MDILFEEKLRAVSSLAIEQKSSLLTEEAVKTAVILNLFQCLGFNPFDPREVVPEFTADVGIRRGEKVDYAIMLEDRVAILVECKSPQTTLSKKHASQLFRYFTVTETRFAVLTNGYDWQFFTDLDTPNKMDERPFLQFSLEELDQTSINELSKFQKAEFDIERILNTASNLKYVSALKAEIRKELTDPTDEFIEMLVRRVYEGRLTANRKSDFEKLVQRGVKEVLRDKVNARLSSALLHNVQNSTETEVATSEEIETTEDEWDGYRIAVAIASKVIDPERVAIRDGRAYCAVLVDDNNRRPLVRLHFNSPNVRYLSLFDGENEDKVKVGKPSDLYQYAERIRATAAKYAS